MFDSQLHRSVQKPLQSLAKACLKLGLSANQVTLLGFAVGGAAAVAISQQAYWLGLLGILLNRIADGLDGAMARLSEVSDAGGYLDISLDFIFYSAIPFAFLLADPDANSIAAGLLMLTFMGTAASFLGFAIQAEKHGIDNPKFPNKSLHYMGGITEGGETIVAFSLMCILPAHFALIAFVFAGLCWLTALSRLWAGYQTLKDRI